MLCIRTTITTVISASCEPAFISWVYLILGLVRLNGLMAAERSPRVSVPMAWNIQLTIPRPCIQTTGQALAHPEYAHDQIQLHFVAFRSF